MLHALKTAAAEALVISQSNSEWARGVGKGRGVGRFHVCSLGYPEAVNQDSLQVAGPLASGNSLVNPDQLTDPKDVIS